MIEELMDIFTDGRSSYVKKRGFEIINRAPRTGDGFPYIVLNGRNGENTIEYVYSHLTNTIPKEVVHPSTHGTNKLVRKIVNHAERGFDLEGSRIDTEPGQKITLYIIDSSWKPIAQKIVKKYSNSK